jgi:TolB protein
MNSSERLTDDGGHKFSPQFTGGEEILYTLFDGVTLMRLMRLRVARGVSEPLHKEASRSELDPTMSADGRYLAFVQLRGTLSLGLQVLDLKRNTSAEVPPESGFCGLRSPAIAPDNTRVLYSFATGGRQKLFSVNMDGGDRRLLTDGIGIDNWPDYSHDGKQVVFSSSRGGGFDVYIMKANGSEMRRLTSGPFRNVRPRFSPDGKHIAFTGFRNGRCRVYVMRADGSNARCVETDSEQDDYPSWHPSGRRLVMVSERSGRHDLYLVKAPL